MDNSPSFCEMVYELIATVPPGKVTTYKDISTNLGYPGNSRHVAACLSSLARDGNKYGDRYKDLPWHRVIRSDMRVAFPSGHPAYKMQHKKLAAEGVKPTAGKSASSPRFHQYYCHKFIYQG